MGFVRTKTGYRADDEQIAFWESRDTCPACGTIVVPFSKEGFDWWYRCDACFEQDGPLFSTEWKRPI